MRPFIAAAILVAQCPNLNAALPAVQPPAAASAAASGESVSEGDVIATINGAPIRRSEVMDRVWKQYANQTLNEMADEILIRQAAQLLKVKPDEKEAEARLKRIQDQLKDEATLKERLAAQGSSLDALRNQINEQLLREALIIKAKNISVSDAEVKEFFDANKEKLGAPASVHLRHLLVSSEQQAEDFSTAIRAGADFEKLASRISLDAATKERGGDVGFVSRGMLQPDLEKVVFSLKPGEITPSMRGQDGFHIFRVESVRPAKPASYSEIKADLKKALLADRIGKAWPAYLQELRDKAKYEPVKPRHEP